MSVKVYVEGGGDSKALKTACRQGFSTFIKKAGLAGRMPSIVACGSRAKTFDRFRKAVANKQTALLLVDGEGPVTETGPWQHLKRQDNWDRPKAATDLQCHLMVQVMESWFLADPDALKSFYGRDFREGSLPANRRIEEISKQDVERGLKHASRYTKKGDYYDNKAKHSFAILAVLNPAKVRCKSRYADRFLSELERRSLE